MTANLLPISTQMPNKTGSFEKPHTILQPQKILTFSFYATVLKSARLKEMAQAIRLFHLQILKWRGRWPKKMSKPQLNLKKSPPAAGNHTAPNNPKTGASIPKKSKKYRSNNSFLAYEPRIKRIRYRTSRRASPRQIRQGIKISLIKNWHLRQSVPKIFQR